MSIKGIHGSGTLAGANACEPRPARSRSNLPPAPEAPAARTHFSGPGQLFSRLTELAEQDPAAFEEIAQKLSDELAAQAEGSSGRASDLAQKLSDRFEQAAQTGDLTAFQARGERGGVDRHHAHHHHHRHDHGEHRSRMGGGEGVRSVLERALDLVHEALQASANPSATPPSATPPSATPPSATPPSATATDATTPSATTPSAPMPVATAPSTTAPTTTDSEV